VLAPLTRIALEHIARAAQPVHVPSGETVIEQGAFGETFYVIVNGALTASVDGRPARQMGAGECFGEIAALHHRPRTATVTADGDCDLLSIDGSTFVLAVTGHKPARHVAFGLTTERLKRDAGA
jgi:CRP-like cAMP-binding protein